MAASKPIVAVLNGEGAGVIMDAECGWAIGVHGSVVHDLDLMAMPWQEEHTTADELARRLTDTNEPKFRRPYEKSKPGDKPNGRIVYTVFMGNTYIDLNVIEK